MSGFEKIEPVYTKLEGWQTSTEGITEFDQLPKAAQKYLRFLEAGVGRPHRHGLDRPRPGADHDSSRVLRSAGLDALQLIG